MGKGNRSIVGTDTLIWRLLFCYKKMEIYQPVPDNCRCVAGFLMPGLQRAK